MTWTLVSVAVALAIWFLARAAVSLRAGRAWQVDEKPQVGVQPRPNPAFSAKAAADVIESCDRLFGGEPGEPRSASAERAFEAECAHRLQLKEELLGMARKPPATTNDDGS